MNIRVMGSNPIREMDVYQCILCVYVVLCRYRHCDRLISHPRSPTICLKKFIILEVKSVLEQARAVKSYKGHETYQQTEQLLNF